MAWKPLHRRHNECDGVSNHQRLDCLLSCWSRRGSKKTAKLRVTGLCLGNSPVIGEFPAQKASNAENVSIWWRHRDFLHMAFWMESFDLPNPFHWRHMGAMASRVTGKSTDLRDWSRSGGSYGTNTRVICCPAPGRPESAARARL